MRRLRPLIAAAMAAGMLACPEISLTAAQQAMYAWYKSVAPSLFPFMALMPLLTGPESAAVYEWLLGRWMRPLLNLPGSAAPALVIGMIAGSPAGAAAAVRTCSSAGLTRSELERLIICACGLSPAFLITGVGASMLGNPADGRILLRAQIASQLLLLICTRNVRPSEPISAPPAAWMDDPVRAAVQGVLSVCGYMVLFSIAAALISRLLRSEIAGLAALCLLDLPSGARGMAQTSLSRELRLVLLAGMSGLGGLCIAAQNLSVCASAGVRPEKYFAGRLIHTALMPALTAAELRLRAPDWKKLPVELPFFALIAVFLSVPTLIFWNKNPFLNKRKSAKR